MTQEDKELLLKDLCARLPYGVMCDIGLDHPVQLQQIFVDRLDGILLDFYEDGKNYQVYLSEVKPYLFPLESMTEEQKKEYERIIYRSIELHCQRYYNVIDIDDFDYLLDFYHKNHLDYRGLIPMGLANDATGLNIY